MNLSNEKLQELLVPPGYIKKVNFAGALEESREDKKELVDTLIDSGLIKDEELGSLIAQDMGFGFVNLRQEKIDEAVLNLIPEIVAKSKGIIAFSKEKDKIKIGMIDPRDLEMQHILEKRFKKKIAVFYITARDHKEALPGYRLSLEEEVALILKNIREPSINNENSDKTIVKIVDIILKEAYNIKTSDVHIEPSRDKILIRFRIDGVMHQVLKLPKKLIDPILTRIKILSKMRIDEHGSAQDGKFQLFLDKETVDIRVSIVPVTEGENIVMRLLSAQAREITLEGLGLNPKDFITVKRVMKNPHGMILVTGPTGCGKTTTIYEILKILNTKEVNIATIEDPVEYNITGISQIQVNAKTDLTFAKGLRAIVRQDPDIIMVGEIRDHETVQIAINSAMTGHLVLSTLHANDAATTLPRLLDMGVEPYLVVSTVNIIIAQRLVRKLCQKCRYSYNLSPEEIDIIKKQPGVEEIITKQTQKELKDLRLFKGAGCKLCSNTGYYGRLGLFEILELKEEIKELIINRASSGEIIKKARQLGMVTMLEDGIEKALNGITDIDEILRVTKA